MSESMASNTEVIARNHDLVETLLLQQDTLNAEPVLLEGFKSGNDLPVYIGLRKIGRTSKNIYLIGLFELLKEEESQISRPVGWIELKVKGNKTIICWEDNTLRANSFEGGELENDKFFYLLAIEAYKQYTRYGINILPQHQLRGLGTKLLQIAYTLGSSLGCIELVIDEANKNIEATIIVSGLEDDPDMRSFWPETDTKSFVFKY